MIFKEEYINLKGGLFYRIIFLIFLIIKIMEREEEREGKGREEKREVKYIYVERERLIWF